MTERWLPIPGYEGWYEVSDLGRVRSVERTFRHRDGRVRTYPSVMVTPTLGRGGYLRVSLSRGGVQRTGSVHQLVMLAFVGPRPPGLEVCHNDDVRRNNVLSNLRYDTKSANAQDALKHGRNREASKVACPWSHLLVAPNLVPSKLAKGHRGCLACSRAGAARTYQRRNGLPVSDMRQLSDEYYEKIMSTAA